MAKAKGNFTKLNKVNKSADFRTKFWFVFSILLILLGINQVHGVVDQTNAGNSSTANFAIGTLIFGSMILGVAIHLTYQSYKRSNGKS